MNFSATTANASLISHRSTSPIAQPVFASSFSIAPTGAVVNCAGATQRGDFATLGDEAWEDGYALKLFGAVRLTRAAWPHLRATGGNVVIIAGVTLLGGNLQEMFNNIAGRLPDGAAPAAPGAP